MMSALWSEERGILYGQRWKASVLNEVVAKAPRRMVPKDETCRVWSTSPFPKFPPMIYQLQNLSPPEFTELVADLLGEALQVRLSKSPEGPDGGIDLLRAGKGMRPQIVVQCKHYLRSSSSGLMRDLRKEVAKVQRINPLRYMVATSQDLTIRKKQEIAGLFAGFIVSEDDIFGGQDIEALLRRYPNVERNHYKLWLGSTNLLSKIIHQGTSVWHQQLLTRLEEHKQVYVQTPSFSKSLVILNKYRIVLIAGGPGVGKTTLANVITASLVAQGFEFREIVDLEHDIKDLPEEGNVVLYYDDFLGHSVWRDTRAGSEKRLENLIRLSERNERFWLILTTRTYLLADARKVSTAVEQRLNKNHEVVLHVDEMSRSTRARILYNHLFFNNVPATACKSLTDWRRLGDILDHANFNPRIVEYVTKSVPEELAKNKYVDFIEGHLKHPSRLYEAAIKDRIGTEARDMLFVLHVLGVPGELNHLYRVWTTLRKEVDQVSANKEVFRRKVKALDANLVEVTKLYTPPGEEPRDGLVFYNPGVGETVRDLLWLYDDRWNWFCDTAESSRELLNLARCHPNARPAVPSIVVKATLPDRWYERWEKLVREGVSNPGGLMADLGKSLSLRVWDEKIPNLTNLLESLHESEDADWIPWSQLGMEPISVGVRNSLSRIPWFEKALAEEVGEFVKDRRNQWDVEEAGELYSALATLVPGTSQAISQLQDAGSSRVRGFIRSVSTTDEIDEDDYYHATRINEYLRLGLYPELAELEERVNYSSSATTTHVSAPQLADDALTEAEVKALFSSLATRRDDEV
jgi:hypothetical protein